MKIGNLPILKIRVSFNGLDKYRLELLIKPTQSEEKWIPEGETYQVAEAYGAKPVTELMFESTTRMLAHLKERYGQEGILNTYDQWGNRIVEYYPKIK